MISKALSFVLLLFIKAYKTLLSPILPPSCRYNPTCSDYEYRPFKSMGHLKVAG